MNEKDKRYFKLLGEALKEEPKRLSKEEKIEQASLEAYLEYIGGARDFMLALKGCLTPDPGVAEEVHRKAVELNMIKDEYRT